MIKKMDPRNAFRVILTAEKLGAQFTTEELLNNEGAFINIHEKNGTYITYIFVSNNTLRKLRNIWPKL